MNFSLQIRERIERNKSDSLAIFLLAAWPFVFFFPATLRQAVFAFGDIFLFFFPTHLAYANALREFRLPLWEPRILDGFPLFAEGQIGALYPTHPFLYGLLPIDLATNYDILIHLAWVAVGMYLFARALKLHPAAAFLAAFAFVAKQRKAFNAEIADSLLRDLGAITAGAATAKGTSQTVDIPDSDIKLACTDECTCTMSINGVEGQLKDNLVFGQDKLKGTKLILWAQDWSLPLRVTNFLFMTTPRVKYYVAGGSTPTDKAVLKALKERIPDNILVEYVDTSGATSYSTKKYLGHDATRFVLIYGNPNSPFTGCDNLDSSFQGTDVSCVFIKPDTSKGLTNAYDVEIRSEPKTAGNTVTFQKTGTYRVVGEGAALAAAFSDSPLQFECNMKRAYKRLGSIANLTAQRSNELEKKRMTAGSTLCPGRSYYCISSLTSPPLHCPLNSGALPPNKLADLEKASGELAKASTLKNSLGASSSPPPQPPDSTMNNLQTSISEINKRNSELLRNDCPLLY